MPHINLVTPSKVELGNKTYFFDRNDAVWTTTPLSAHCNSTLASSASGSTHESEVNHLTVSWQHVEPLTVIHIPVRGEVPNGERLVTFEELEGVLENWGQRDDVWDEKFLQSE
jgi:hypothetical protein